MSKKSIGFIKLTIAAGKATPAPPVGPALGQKGLKIPEVCKNINDATKNFESGTPTRVRIQAFSDKTYKLEILGNPITTLIKKVIKIEKGSSEAGRKSAGNITVEQLKEVALKKMEQGLSARSLNAAMKIVAGSARSMGLKVMGDLNE